MLIKQYPKIMEAAKNLFGSDLVDSKAEDIEKSYSICEAAWERNLSRIEGISIKYLLICEAPSAPVGGHVSYFYETFDNSAIGKPTIWIRSLLFMLNNNRITPNLETCLDRIANLINSRNSVAPLVSWARFMPCADKFSTVEEKIEFSNLLNQRLNV